MQDKKRQRKGITVLVPEDLHKKIKAQAKREGRMLQRVVEQCLVDGIKAAAAREVQA